VTVPKWVAVVVAAVVVGVGGYAIGSATGDDGSNGQPAGFSQVQPGQGGMGQGGMGQGGMGQGGMGQGGFGQQGRGGQSGGFGQPGQGGMGLNGPMTRSGGS
jgi:general secretion pathway protein D